VLRNKSFGAPGLDVKVNLAIIFHDTSPMSRVSVTFEQSLPGDAMHAESARRMSIIELVSFLF
jgi:hypothetical protein